MSECAIFNIESELLFLKIHNNGYFVALAMASREREINGKSKFTGWKKKC
jgi:hypothetical protein